MASKTKKTEMRRLRKSKGMGRKRKNKTTKVGSTKSAKALFKD